jgi:hypothetical protein
VYRMEGLVHFERGVDPHNRRDYNNIHDITTEHIGFMHEVGSQGDNSDGMTNGHYQPPDIWYFTLIGGVAQLRELLEAGGDANAMGELIDPDDPPSDQIHMCTPLQLCVQMASGNPLSIHMRGSDRTLETLTVLLAHGADTGRTDVHRQNALGQLTYRTQPEHRQHKLEMVKKIILHGTDPTSCGVSWGASNSLSNAAESGWIELASFLLENGVDVNKTYDHVAKITPLHTAALHGDINMVRMFVMDGADVFAENDMLETATELAYVNRHISVARYLDRQQVLRRVSQCYRNYRRDNPRHMGD